VGAAVVTGPTGIRIEPDGPGSATARSVVIVDVGVLTRAAILETPDNAFGALETDQGSR
jgi:hypothetical protein